MTALTLTIEPDELLGLNALAELSGATDQGADVGALTAGDPLSKARELLRTAIGEELGAAGLPWAPSPDAVREQIAQSAKSPGTVRRLLADVRVRKYGLSALAVVVLVLLWGGYSDHWQWTGFAGNSQLWDWLHLLLLPVVLGTIPLWIEHPEYISRTRRVIYVTVIVAWIGFVIAGYLVPLNWTGFSGNTLWDWFELIMLPLAIAIVRIWPSGRSVTPYHKGGLATLSVALIITLIGGYGLSWNWTGYPGNTLWDWLQLVLVPIVFSTILIPGLVKWVTGDVAGRAKAAHAAAMAPPEPPAAETIAAEPA